MSERDYKKEHSELRLKRDALLSEIHDINTQIDIMGKDKNHDKNEWNLLNTQVFAMRTHCFALSGRIEFCADKLKG